MHDLSIAIGSDHAGYELKERLKDYLASKQISVKDFGTYSKDSVDYPDVAVRVAQSVGNKEFSYGILICGSGIGMSIVANKIENIRAALCTSEKHAEMSRMHNDANVLTLGERYTPFDLACRITDTFLATAFENAIRHKRRVDKIHSLTNC